MKKFLPLVLALIAATAWAGSNLNLSKSNVNRVVYDTTVLTPAQAAALLADLDKLGPATEARAKHWLASNFRHSPKLFMRVVPARAGIGHTPLLIILTSPADEAAAIAKVDSFTVKQ